MRQLKTSLVEALSLRRSVRVFLPDPVEPIVVATISNQSARAPSGSNIQLGKCMY